MPPPPTFQQQALNVLMMNAAQINSRFNNSDDRIILRDATRSVKDRIEQQIQTLMKNSKLKPALSGPSSAWNNFQRAWLDGQGDLIKCKQFVSEFWRLLDNAKTELEAAVTPAPGPSPGGAQQFAPQEIELFKTILADAGSLLDRLPTYIRTRNKETEAAIRVLVGTITELLTKGGPVAQQALNRPKETWADFSRYYKETQYQQSEKALGDLVGAMKRLVGTG